jgi:uncharacterized protein (UPF0179 family)
MATRVVVFRKWSAPCLIVPGKALSVDVELTQLRSVSPVKLAAAIVVQFSVAMMTLLGAEQSK